MSAIEISQLPISTTLLPGTSIAVENSNVTQRILGISIKDFVSNLGNLTVSGNIITSNISVSGKITGTLYTAAQPQITSLGSLTGLTIAGSTTSRSIAPSTTGTYDIGTDSTRYANIYAGNLIVDTVYGQITDTELPDVVVVGNLNSLSVVGVSSLYGNLVISSDTQTVDATSGALVVAGGASINKDLILGGDIYISGAARVSSTTRLYANVVAAAGTLSTSKTTGAIVIPGSGGIGIGGAATANQFVSTDGYFWANGAIYAPPVLPHGIDGAFQFKHNKDFYGSDNFVYSEITGNVILSGGSHATSPRTGVLVVDGDAGITGNIYIGGSAGNAIITQSRIYAGDMYINDGVFWANGTMFSGEGVPRGNIGAIQYNNGVNFSGTDYFVYDPTTTNVTISSGTTSSNTATGALVVTGGVGVAGTLNVTRGQSEEGFFWANGTIFSGLGIPGGSNFNLQYKDNETFAGTVGMTYAPGPGNLVIEGTTASNTTTTGALVVGGGVGVAGNVVSDKVFTGNGYFWANGTVYAGTTQPAGSTSQMQYNFDGVMGGAPDFIYTRANGNVIIGSTTESYGLDTGALIVKGGVAIHGNLVIGGSVSNAIVTGSAIYAGPVFAGGNVHVAGSGVRGSQAIMHLFDTATTVRIGGNATTVNLATSTSSVVQPTANAVTDLGSPGLYWNNLYANTAVFNSLIINSEKPSSIAAPTQFTNTSIATSATNAALTVAGGMGIAGNLYIAGSGGNAAVVTGNIIITGNIAPTAAGTYNLGTPTTTFKTVYARATSAIYADLAEKYLADRHYEPGTVVVFGGDKEVTETNDDHDPRVAGVISTDPAYLMNADSEGLPVALTGRVPCKVIGPISKGDLLVTSRIAGVAQRIIPDRFVPGCVLGKSLENVAGSEITTIEVVVGKV